MPHHFSPNSLSGSKSLFIHRTPDDWKFSVHKVNLYSNGGGDGGGVGKTRIYNTVLTNSECSEKPSSLTKYMYLKIRFLLF